MALHSCYGITNLACQGVWKLHWLNGIENELIYNATPSNMHQDFYIRLTPKVRQLLLTKPIFYELSSLKTWFRMESLAHFRGQSNKKFYFHIWRFGSVIYLYFNFISPASDLYRQQTPSIDIYSPGCIGGVAW